MLKFGSKNDVNSVIKCSVRLLDDSELVECDIQVHHKGKYLLDHVCQQLNLLEVDYFGLRYNDSNKLRHWLDPSKNILKQVKDVDPLQFSFRVKFYPPDPFKLKEEITRYQIYLQLKRDLLHGRLYCDPNTAAQLGAYILQEDLGDFNPEEHVGNYVSELKILLKQTQFIEEKMMEFHEKLQNQSPEQVETAFLKKACALDTYGVDPQSVKDHAGTQIYLGINHTGILTFLGNKRTTRYVWKQVQNINYEGKMFIVHLVYHEDPRTKRKETVGFKCASNTACRLTWRNAIEQKLFFTLTSSAQVPSVVSGGGFFSWGSKFKYTGRVEREILEDLAPLRREEPTVSRVGSLRRKAASVPATPSTPVVSDLGYSSLPRSNYSTDFRSDVSADGTGLETVSEDAESRSQRLNDQLDGDYLVRDSSFDHSSSESQIQSNLIATTSLLGSLTGAVGVGGGSSSHRSTPVNKQHSSLAYHHLATGSSQTGSSSLLTSKKTYTNLFRVFLRAFLVATILLLFLTVFVIETEYELFASIRSSTEIVQVKRNLYDPLKKYVKHKVQILYS